MNESSKEIYNARAWTLLLALALVWGSSFILMKRGLEVYSPAQVAALRMSIAALCLLPFVAHRWKEVPRKDWKYIAAVGFLGNCIPAFLFTNAETQLSSSLAGILNALTPLFSLVVSIALFKTRTSLSSIIGVVLGLAGAVIIMMFRANGTIETNYLYGSYVVLATLCYAFSVNIIRNRLYAMDSVLIAGWALCVVGSLSTIYLFTTDFTHRLQYEGSGRALGFVTILAVLGTSVSLVFYNRLIKISGVLFASSTTYFIPVVALLWGMLDNEKPGLIQLGGLGVILAGVYLVNKK